MNDDSDISVSIQVARDSANSYDEPRLSIRRHDDEIEIVTERPERSIRVSANDLIRAVRLLMED